MKAGRVSEGTDGSTKSSSSGGNNKKKSKASAATSNGNSNNEEGDSASPPSYIPAAKNLIDNIELYNKKDPLAVIRSHFGDEMLPKWIFPEPDIEGEESMYENHTDYYKDVKHDFVWCPIRFESNLPNDFGIYYTMVNRMDYLERLLKEPNLPTEVTMSLLEVQDRYQLLSLHMETNNQYRNADLITPTISTSISPLQLYYPSQNKVITLNILPDLFNHVFYCKIWGDKMDIPYTDPRILEIIAILVKPFPSPCKGRSVTTILPDTWLPDDDDKWEFNDEGNLIFNITVRIIVAGLLGCYDHCKVRANFQARRKIYKWFSMNTPQKEEVANWIRKNKHLIIYIMREYIFFLIDGLPALHKFLDTHYYWYHMIKNTHDAMDLVRKHMNTLFDEYSRCYPLINVNSREPLFDTEIWDKIYFPQRDEELISKALYWEPRKSWFIGLGPILAGYNKTNLNYCHRPIEQSFVDHVVEIMEKIDDAHYGDPSYTIDESDFSPEDEEMIRKVLFEGIPMDKSVSYEWLCAFYHVSLSSVLKLKASENLYVKETSRSKVKTVLTEMAKKKYRDYYILKVFFVNLKKKYALITYPLPWHITELQIKRLHEHYQTLPGQPLNEHAGCYYICPNCNEIKATVVPSNSVGKTNKERERTLSFERVSVDMVTGDLYCSKQSSKNNPKKRTVTTDVVSEIMGTGTDKKKENKKQSKDMRRKKITQSCPKTKLIKINMIGQQLRTDKWGIVIICPMCLSLTTMGRSAYENMDGQLSCGCARQESLYVKTLKQLNQCGICMKEHNPSSNHSNTYHLLYDDVTEPENPRIRYVAICDAHGISGNSWIESFKTILKLSQVRYSIQNGLTSKEINDGEDRIFTKSRNRRYNNVI